MENQNPFVFGKIVRGTDFCGRKEEIHKIKAIIQSKNNLVIISPRRYGKTSLIINALEKSKISFLFLDCMSIGNEETLLERLTLSYLQKLKQGDMINKIRYLSKTIHIEYTFSLDGLNIKVQRYDSLSLERLIQEISKEYILVFDEFQELFTKDTELVKRLRSILQDIKQSYIFLGSRKHLLLFLFSDQKSPLYNFAAIMNLPKIHPQEWRTFIETKSKGVLLSTEDINIILEYAEEIPFYVQYLAYHFWEERRRNKSSASTEIMNKILLSNEYVYEELYTRIPLSQQRALKIIAMKEEKRFSEDILKRYEIKNPQILNKAINALEEKGILDRNGEYHFNDPLLKQYILSSQK